MALGYVPMPKLSAQGLGLQGHGQQFWPYKASALSNVTDYLAVTMFHITDGNLKVSLAPYSHTRLEGNTFEILEDTSR